MFNGLTIKEASLLLGMSERTVRRYVKVGKLMARKVNGRKGLEYRFDEEYIKKYVGQNGKAGQDGQKFANPDQIMIPKDFYFRYEQALIRLGQLENQRHMLMERAESLQRIEEDYQKELEDLKKALERERIEKEMLAQKLGELTKKKKWWQFSWR